MLYSPNMKTKALKSKTLFLVHIEEMFREEFPPMFVQRVCKAMNDYNDIYIFISNAMECEPIREICRTGCFYTQIQWGWGYYPEQFKHDVNEQSWVIPANGQEYTWIPEELRCADNWKDHEISLGGGCRSECLQSMRDILDYQEISYKPINGLIY